MQVFNRSTLLLGVLLAVAPLNAAFGQSTNQGFPTPVTSNEITGTIKARDVGDSRLTSYFYQFDGDQGDLFINIVARNFTGDIDVFTQNGLRPLTKIVIYADFDENETGRVIYLRKPEKMLLRVQGRSPGDDAATFRIKFAGSFVASTQSEPVAEPVLPTPTAKNDSGIRVNSVGTIVEIIPKATPTPAPVDTAVTDERTEAEVTEKKETDAAAETKSDDKSVDSAAGTSEKKLEVVVTENIPEKTETTTAPAAARRSTRGRRPPPKRSLPVESVANTTTTASPAKASPPKSRRTPPKTTAAKAPDPLENVNLVIQFKDGSVIERRMSEVFRFTVDKGVLTVIAKDGSIGRYSILDVSKVTIQ